MKRHLIAIGAIACLAGALALAACSGGTNDAPSGGEAPGGASASTADAYAVASPAFPQTPSEDDGEAWMKTLDENPLDEEFVESLSGFSYKTASAVLGEESENSTYSPISLYYALALATQGAAGQTADEMNAVLKAPDPSEVPLEAGNLYRVFYGDPFSKIDLANSIWMREGDSFEQDFVDVATQQFYATPFSVEFGTPEADAAIADWISANTNGTIEPEVQTTSDQLMSIINTVYFKGSWSDQFDAASTREDTFHTASGDVTAEFMTQRLDKPRDFVQTDTYTRASLDFVGGATMSFVLPAEGVSAHDIISDEALLEEAFTADPDDAAYITYTVPKTTFASSFDLIPPLESLGMKTAFSDEADFSKLTSTPAYISHIKQESYIMWDENGAEASAYTDIGISEMSAAPENLKEMEFTLDRPFLFEIRSSQGVPLFIGVCENPEANA